MAPAVDQ